MSTAVILQARSKEPNHPFRKVDLAISATVATADRVIYVNVDGVQRDFERVGLSGSTPLYRDQNNS